MRWRRKERERGVSQETPRTRERHQTKAHSLLYHFGFSFYTRVTFRQVQAHFDEEMLHSTDHNWTLKTKVSSAPSPLVHFIGHAVAFGPLHTENRCRPSNRRDLGGGAWCRTPRVKKIITAHMDVRNENDFAAFVFLTSHYFFCL